MCQRFILIINLHLWIQQLCCWIVLQDDPALFDRVYLSDGVAGLLALVRAVVECYRCKGAHYK